MLRKIVTTICCTLVTYCCAFAQEFSANRWKETSRTDQRKKKVDYTDTFRLNVVGKDAIDIRKGSFIYKGKLEDRILQVGDIMYIVLKNDKDEIQLQDEDNIHIFSREIKDQSAADASSKMAGIELPAKPVGNIDRELLQGNWESYKRRGRNGPLEKIDYTTLIKTLSFNLSKEGAYYGAITTTQVGGKVLYSIKETSASNLVVEDAEKKEHLLIVWKLSNEELIIEDENKIIYYMKHFK